MSRRTDGTASFAEQGRSSATRAQNLLEKALGEGAVFRDGQLEAILALVDDRSRVLVVERTGWGKSLVYFVATALLREQGQGPTILISPLLSLMRDQLRMAKRIGIQAQTINSQNDGYWEEVEHALRADEVDILLISPERLANDRFRSHTLEQIPLGLGMFVVDEAHCISDWGHDFRPDYRRIRGLMAQLPRTVPLLATTATANNRVIADIAEQLGAGLRVIRGPLGRDSLCLQIVECLPQAERLAWLGSYVPSATGSGIIYVLTHRDARMVSGFLAARGIDAPSYLGSLPASERETLERRLLENEVKALVATVALGMGFDKPDLGFVVHYQRPSSPIAYYQQIGRAGRALERAEVVLLAGKEDDAIADYFIENAFPAEHEMHDVLAALDGVEDATVAEIQKLLNLSKGAIERALKILEVEGAVSREGSRFARTPNEWSADSERMEQVTAQRMHERDRMAELVQADGCLMGFLRAELDDPVGEPCGRCANCAGPFAEEEPDEADVEQALRFLLRMYRPIEARKRWPGGLDGRRGSIPVEHCLREGRALSIYGDAGWGKLVKAGKYGGEGFAEELIGAVAEMLTDRWRPEQTPTWVTAVPSYRAPDLLPSFARRLAGRLGLEYREALEKTADTPQQRTMENSYHQASNALSSYRAIPEAVLAEPVFLVDGLVDSGWSLTVCGVLLAEAGAGPVVPIALAETSKGAQ
jgi:ATP-dependent DNA helicase RecQ